MEKMIFALILFASGTYVLIDAIKILFSFLAGHGVKGMYKPFGQWEYKTIKTKSKFNRGLALVVGLLMYPLLSFIFFIWALSIIKN